MTISTAYVYKATVVVGLVVVLTGCTSVTGHIDTPSRAPSPATTSSSHSSSKAAPVGGVLPDPTLTPGATDPRVTQANIDSTICRVGYTKTVRPKPNYTTALKIHQLQTGYTYKGDTDTRHYEEDHLIPLELGGSPIAVKNLWPEPYATTRGARSKDRIENRLHALVCTHQLSLRVAQHAIAANWIAAYRQYIHA